MWHSYNSNTTLASFTNLVIPKSVLFDLKKTALGMYHLTQNSYKSWINVRHPNLCQLISNKEHITHLSHKLKTTLIK